MELVINALHSTPFEEKCTLKVNSQTKNKKKLYDTAVVSFYHSYSHALHMTVDISVRFPALHFCSSVYGSSFSILCFSSKDGIN